MNKLIAVVASSLATLGLATEHASAWFNDCCSGCNRCCTTICLRQYNAFTPVCCGSLSCDGCCPMTFSGCCQPSCPMVPPCGGCGCGLNGFGPTMGLGGGYGPPLAMNGGYGPPPQMGGYGPGMPAGPMMAPLGVPAQGTPGLTLPPGVTTEPPSAPGSSTPGFRAPMPKPADASSGPAARVLPPAGAVQYVAYRPMYYPAYMPVVPAYAMPAPGMMPYYWNGAAPAGR